MWNEDGQTEFYQVRACTHQETISNIDSNLVAH